MADITIVSSSMFQPQNINQTEIYFPFAGRLVKVNNLEDNTVSFYIDCDNGLGARFVHAESKSLSVSDILQPHCSVPDFMNHFFPVFNVKSCDGVSEPLLTIQVTEIKDGVFISFCYNHLVADGVSMWGFFHTWSKICSSGSDFVHQPLVLKRWFLDGIDYPIHIPVSETETSPPPPRNNELSSVPITEDRVFHFTKKNISDLKAKANSEVGSSDLKISSLQAVSAHMWRSIIRHNALSREGETHCKVAVDIRQRMNPPLEKECFGNMVYLPTATATVGELLDRGLGWAALQISKFVSSQTNEKHKTFAEEWIRNFPIIKSGVGSRMAGDSIVVAGSARFEVYNNDFGWGKPIAVRAGPGNSISGKLVLFQGIDEGSIDIQATLWSDVLVNLLADVEFLEHVTIV
ncbi:putative acetyltransferase [Cardamine amara subsp. amara]|uniref:Acetyltransferase n=1 Tax=Cardamine amara subsp. amara TaxID=228776 RepID=A0ABD1BBQ7_CARAN